MFPADTLCSSMPSHAAVPARTPTPGHGWYCVHLPPPSTDPCFMCGFSRARTNCDQDAGLRVWPCQKLEMAGPQFSAVHIVPEYIVWGTRQSDCRHPAPKGHTAVGYHKHGKSSGPKAAGQNEAVYILIGGPRVSEPGWCMR